MDSWKYINWGLKPYKEAFEAQESLHAELVQNKLNQKENTQYFVLCQHPHVYTLGKSGVSGNLLIHDDFLKRINATYFQSNRGGDITYHGPEQIVGYPILDLGQMGFGVRDYISKMEQAIMNTLKQYDIESSRMEGATGVWLDVNTPQARKICAIGVRVSRLISMHGFALNVNTDLTYFKHINPCGFQDKQVTSIEKELHRKVNVEEVEEKLLKQFAEVFNVNIV